MRQLSCSSVIFDIIGASVVGSSHQKVGKPCQDFFHIAAEANWAVVVVSDGAGSASRSEDGARIVCEEVTKVTKEYFNDGSLLHLSSISFPELARKCIFEGITRARSRCAKEVREGENLGDFNATLVGVLLHDGEGVAFHIGDGGISIHRTCGSGIEPVAFSKPENGEYINETYFFTDSWWREHLRFTDFQRGFDSIWIMTDGSYYLCVTAPREARLRDFTVNEIDRLTYGIEKEGKSDALAAILSSPFAAHEDDDKTLVILRRREF